LILRYQQSKDQSAELLRLVMAKMSQHDAAFNPVTFTDWYEHVAGMNASLSQAIERLMQTTPRLGDAEMWQLYQSYVADVDPQAMHRIGTQLHQLMQGMADTAEHTGDQASEFELQLSGLAAALGSDNQALMTQMLEQVIQGTVQMRQAARMLETEVKSGHHEINRLKNELTRVRDESLQDTLTQVLNRKGFDQKLQSMLVQPAKEGRSHGLIMLDLDHFKGVNDTHGHVMGDRVLQAMGEVLRACVPTSSGNSVARYGGEEFAIVMPDTSPDACLKMAEIVRLHTKTMKVRDRRSQTVVLQITVSGGVAMMQDGDDAQTLVARADGALYQSKQAGRDRITVA
jgi:diguanylate cyclase